MSRSRARGLTSPRDPEAGLRSLVYLPGRRYADPLTVTAC
jgi:hypothetical protein